MREDLEGLTLLSGMESPAALSMRGSFRGSRLQRVLGRVKRRPQALVRCDGRRAEAPGRQALGGVLATRPLACVCPWMGRQVTVNPKSWDQCEQHDSAACASPTNSPGSAEC